ncbi:MAG TPA: hypothetical protein VIO36_15310 [Anaerolineaceae bacterium]
MDLFIENAVIIQSVVARVTALFYAELVQEYADREAAAGQGEEREHLMHIQKDCL